MFDLFGKKNEDKESRGGRGSLFGRKDASQRGWKKGGRGRNRTSICRHPESKKERKESHGIIDIKMPKGLNVDTDSDGILDFNDCQPLNSAKQGEEHLKAKGPVPDGWKYKPPNGIRTAYMWEHKKTNATVEVRQENGKWIWITSTGEGKKNLKSFRKARAGAMRWMRGYNETKA